MKKIALLLLLINLTAFSQGKNLVKNGSFEKGMTNWETDTESGSKASFGTDGDIFHSGPKGLKTNVILLGPNSWNIHMLQPFNSTKNKNYEITLYAKTDTNELDLKLQVQNITYTHETFPLTKQWKQYTWNFTAKENDLIFGIHFIGRGKYYIDDIVVKEVKKSLIGKKMIDGKPAKKTASSSKIIINNGDFESGLQNWTNMSEGGSYADYSVNTKTPYEGQGAMKVEVKKLGKEHWSVQSLIDTNVKKNKRYRLSFYGKTSGTGQKIKVQMQDQIEKIFISNTFSYLTNKWKLYEWDFNADSSAMQFAFHYMQLGTYEFDNVEIKQIKKK